MMIRYTVYYIKFNNDVWIPFQNETIYFLVREIPVMGKTNESVYYLSCSYVVMKDVTPLTPQALDRDSIFKRKQHTTYDPRRPDTFNFTTKAKTTVYVMFPYTCQC